MLIIVSHGFSSPGMFRMANFNYEVGGSRNILFQKGCSSVYPIGSLFWFLLLAANIAAPPSLNLVSEVFICISMLKLGIFMSFFIGLVTFISAGYNLYLYSAQQGSCTLFLQPAGFYMVSFFYLSCILHIVPVFFSTFLLVLFCVWKNSLIL